MTRDQDIAIPPGDNISITYEVDADLTGSTVVAYFETAAGVASFNRSSAVAGEIDFVSAKDGSFTLNLVAANTVALAEADYPYYITMTTGIVVYTIAKGYLLLGGVVGHTSRARVKPQVGLAATDTADDGLLDYLVDAATDVVNVHCGRRFRAETYTHQRLDGTGHSELQLPHFPVNYISALSTGTTEGLRIDHNGDSDQAFVRCDSRDLTLRLVGGTFAGTDVLLLSDYADIDALVAAIIALGKNWVAASQTTASGALPTTELLPTDADLEALDNYAYIQIPDGQETNYLLDAAEGLVTLAGGFPGGRQNILVTYNAGYSEPPAAVKQVTAKLAANMYYDAKRDTTLKSETLGDYSWTAGTTTAETGLSTSAIAKLTPYCELMP